MEQEYNEQHQAGVGDLAGKDVRLQLPGGRAVPRLPQDLSGVGLKFTPPLPPATSCPAKAPAHGDTCNAVATLECVGSGYVETCYGSYGGDRSCTCLAGKWNCPNVFCGSFCPKTLAAAKQSPACVKPKGEESAACYYQGGALCTCSGGSISCS